MHFYFSILYNIHILFLWLVCEFGIALDMLQVVGDILVAIAELDGLIEDATSWVRGPEIRRFSSTLFNRAIVPAGAKCYHIYSSQATIFYFLDTVHFSARALTYEMLRWAVLTDHYCISGLLYSPMSELSLRTLRFEDRCSHLVITEQLLMPSFISALSHWTDDGSDQSFKNRNR